MDYRKISMGGDKRDWKAVRLVTEPPQPYPFYSADMATEEGGLKELGEKVAVETAVRITQHLLSLPQYRVLASILPSERLALFFEKQIHARIYPVMRSLCAMEWFIENCRPPDRAEVVWLSHQGLGTALQEVWPSAQVSLTLGAPKPYAIRFRPWARGLRAKFYHRIGRQRIPKLAASPLKLRRPDSPTIAVHYTEGIDLSRRSDLFWLPTSNVDPERILMYFDTIVRPRGSALESVAKDLTTLGVNWIDLGDRSLENVGGSRNGSPNRNHNRSGSLYSKWKEGLTDIIPESTLEHWLIGQAEYLLGETEYWLSFYDDHNVKIHLESHEGDIDGVAQSIVLDMSGGIHVGWERSDSWGPGLLGRHPHHVYFAWNRRAVDCAQENRNRINSALISGFPHDKTWGSAPPTQEVRAQLAAKDVEFVVALFDNMFWWGGAFSWSIMKSFYTAFLQWVLEDPQVGVITKSKKPHVLEDLPEIRDLMTKAEATGRWINLDNVTGRLPSDASRVADLSVGIGISSAITEAVAAGAKGVHCDLSPKRSHPFYQWGYEKVVFDDLDRMMAAFKRHKADPASEPELGDFSHNLEQVDPFRDGQASERVGTYLRWLLEGFDEGNDRDSVMRNANQKYMNTWGVDKVISHEITV